MLTFQSQSEPHQGEGSLRSDLAELRRQMTDPSRNGEVDRQRLTALAKKLARIRALGGEYSRVSLSEDLDRQLAAITH